jgi:CHAT domain-containing protein
MDQIELARLLVNVEGSDREDLLARHAELAGESLAWELKAIYDQEEARNPVYANQAAVALAALARVRSEPKVVALADWLAGMMALDAGEFDAALQRLEAAEQGFERIQERHLAAQTRVSKLRAQAITGCFEEAIQTGQQALAVFLEANDQLAAGKIEQNLGNLHYILDEYQAAEKLYRSARQRYEIINDNKQLIQIDNCLALALTSQHRFKEAQDMYAQASQQAEAAGEQVTQAEIESNQGTLALYQGAYDQALEYLERSRRRYSSLGMSGRAAIADQELAEAYVELNLIPEAISIFERILPVLKEGEMQVEWARACLYYARARLAQGNFSAATHLLAQAEQAYREAGNTFGVASVRLVEAMAHHAQGAYPLAESVAAEAETSFAAVNAWGQHCLARWLRGDSARRLGEVQKAEGLLKQALQDAEQWQAAPVAVRCLISSALLASAQGDLAQAETAFKAAIQRIEAMRAPLPADEFRTAFLADKLTPYIELVRMCLADGSPTRWDEAFEYAEKARSRALVDMLTGALPASPSPEDEYDRRLFERMQKLREELNWYYNQVHRPDEDTASRGGELMEAHLNAIREREVQIAEITLQLQQSGSSIFAIQESFDVDQFRLALDDDTVLVEYFSLDSSLLAFVVSSASIEVVHLPVSEQEIETALTQFHFQLGALKYGAKHLAQHLETLIQRTQHHLLTLYDGLVLPIEQYLGDRRVVFVPYRALHYIPFHALYDGSQYLVERYEVSYAPSAAVLHHCLNTPRRPLQRAVLVGVSDERNPQVKDEVLALSALFSNPVTLIDAEATLPALHQHTRHADLLHMACHGQFRPDNPLFSSLQLGDGWLTVRDAYRLNLDCDLLTLSACETGLNAFSPGDELLGMARGFLAAGAPALLVSLWIVDDKATASLMVDFYTSLREGAGPAAALRTAQRRQMQRTSHPYFWAPFALMGRW